MSLVRVPLRRSIALIAILAYSAIAPALGAAEGRLERRGEMERPASTTAAWVAQAGKAAAPDGPTPVLLGCHMWGGRADRDYKPFFQWELKLAGGTEPISGLSLRIDPLDGQLEPIDGKAGHTVPIGRLGPGKSLAFSYKLNCPSPLAYRIVMEWDGGEGVWLATDKQMLPQRKGEVGDLPQLILLEPMWNWVSKKRKGEVGFYLRNDGGADAHGVAVTIDLLAEGGKKVGEHVYVPGDDGVVPKGYAGFEEVIIPKCPKFSSVRLRTTSAEDGKMSLDPGSFTGAEDLEYAGLTAKDGVLHLKIRNGLKEAAEGVTVSVELQNESGSPIKRLDIDAGDLAPGEVKPLTAPLEGVGEFAGYTIGFGFGQPVQGGAAGDPSKPRVAVNDLVVVFDNVSTVSSGLLIEADITNTGSTDLTKLTCELEVGGDGGDPVTVTIPVGTLAAGATHRHEFSIKGLTSVTGLGIGYRTGR